MCFPKVVYPRDGLTRGKLSWAQSKGMDMFLYDINMDSKQRVPAPSRQQVFEQFTINFFRVHIYK